MIRGVALLLTLASATVPASAQPAGAAPAGEAVVDKSSPDYVRCRRIEVTGSRARKEKICKTNAEWDAIARAGNDSSREQLERSQSVFRAE
jgi:hypothetical protein